MKTSRVKKSLLLFSTVLFAAFSCNDEDRLSVQDNQDISEEALTDSYFQDMDDLAGVAVQAPTETQFSGGREKATFTVTNDHRFRCNGEPLTITLNRTSTDPNNPQGTIIVDFGTGCTDLKGNTRSGKLTFQYNGRRFMPGSTVIITGQNFRMNGVLLEGTRTLTNVTASSIDAPSFNATLVNGKATFEDGTTATRQSNITWTWIRNTNPSEDKLVISTSSTASGVTRGGRNYAVSILQALEYKRFCGIAVKGVKRYLINNEKEVVIDYGDGTCDRSMTVTVNGETRNITVN